MPDKESTQPQREPATSFKWVIIAAVVIWLLGAAIIVPQLIKP